ncbi:MAG: transposase [Candidatus Cloacimonas sp. SDB]|nr:MAG: transposase [Candidatus Cloacimonas sp. SDB]
MKSRYSINKIIKIIKEYENGRSVPDITREYGICNNTFYRWKSKYGGLDASEAKRLKELEDENRRLKKIVAEKELYIDALKSVVEKKY